jgi:peptide chain release factor 1
VALDFPPPEELKAELAALTDQMAEEGSRRNVSTMKRLSHEHTTKQALLELVERFELLQAELNEAQTLAEDDSDPEMAVLAAEDVTRLTATIEKTYTAIEELLIPHDPRDERDVILEIRAGAGGEEASLFAAELFRAYNRFGETQGWQIHLVSSTTTEQGGFKEVVAEITGKQVFGRMKYERGVHRVQRVPATEKQGRIHTSTVTVAVLPQAEEVDITVKTEDLRIDTYRASGAGGQHVNKTSSAVRITHLPTNTVVAVQDERSQHKNKAKAMSILRARLLEAQEEAKHKEQASARKLQVGTGDRSEKIRTYNFPQDRITDHRIKQSWGNILVVMEGAWEPIFKALQEEDKKLALQREK